MKNETLKSVYLFFKSVKLAIGLILYITLTSILATLVPQGKELTFYSKNYPSLVSWLITATGFHDFFHSFLFLFPAFILTLNLLVCTIDRLVKEFSEKRKKRFGPDLIHLGILLLIVGAMITFLNRQEGFFYLTKGEQVKLAGKYILTLNDFLYQTYDDGRPKEWISDVSVYADDKVLIDSFPIEVNKPLELQGFKVYQTSYALTKTLLLKDETGDIFRVPTDHPITTEGDITLVFNDIEVSSTGEKNVILQEWQGQQITGYRTLKISDPVGKFTVQDAEVEKTTGLTAVKDPGYLPVLIAGIIIVLGLSLTYIQKIGEKEL